MSDYDDIEDAIDAMILHQRRESREGRGVDLGNRDRVLALIRQKLPNIGPNGDHRIDIKTDGSGKAEGCTVAGARPPSAVRRRERHSAAHSSSMKRRPKTELSGQRSSSPAPPGDKTLASHPDSLSPRAGGAAVVVNSNRAIRRLS